MILDERTEFCDATALNTGGAASYVLGDQIDLTLARGIGLGEPIYFVITVDTTATSGGSATAVFSLVSDSTAALATDGSSSVHFATSAIPVATLVAGYMVCAVALPIEGVLYERYLGVLQTTAVAAFTAGKINAFLTHDVSKWKAYADASN